MWKKVNKVAFTFCKWHLQKMAFKVKILDVSRAINK